MELQGVQRLRSAKVPENDVVKIKAPRFSPNQNGEGEFWLVNTTHGDNLRLVNKWLTCQLVIPSFTQSIQASEQLLSRSKEVKEVGIFQCDGEREQLDVFTDPKVRKSFLEYGINAMKHSAGCSLMWQANDVGHCHSSLHKLVGSQRYSKLLQQNAVAEMKSQIDATQSRLQEAGMNLIDTDTIHKVMRAFEVIQPVLPFAFTPSSIVSSFSECGLWDPSLSDCNIEKMLRRSQAFKNFDGFDDLVERVKQRCKEPRDGLCLESELDELNIPLTPEEKERQSNPRRVALNDRVPNMQRAFIYTGEGFDEWDRERRAKIRRRNNEKKIRRDQNDQKKKNAADSRKAKQLRARRIAECMGNPPPMPNVPVLDDVQCVNHGIWQGTWMEKGLGEDGWRSCRKCLCWFCNK